LPPLLLLLPLPLPLPLPLILTGTSSGVRALSGEYLSTLSRFHTTIHLLLDYIALSNLALSAVQQAVNTPSIAFASRIC
jgi:hypothetical protein